MLLGPTLDVFVKPHNNGSSAQTAKTPAVMETSSKKDVESSRVHSLITKPLQHIEVPQLKLTPQQEALDNFKKKFNFKSLNNKSELNFVPYNVAKSSIPYDQTDFGTVI